MQIVDLLRRLAPVDASILWRAAAEVAALGQIIVQARRGAGQQCRQHAPQRLLGRHLHLAEYFVRGVVRQDGHFHLRDDGAGIRLDGHFMQRGAGDGGAMQRDASIRELDIAKRLRPATPTLLTAKLNHCARCTIETRWSCLGKKRKSARHSKAGSG